MNPTVALSRSEALRLMATPLAQPTLFVDTLNGAPMNFARYCIWNPFYSHAEACIPVPGTALYSRSVEAVWQGLKVIDDQIDVAMFNQIPHKRPAEEKRRTDSAYNYSAARFRLGQDEVDLVTARFIIYIPTFLFVLEELTPASLFDEVRATMAGGGLVVFYDWDECGDPTDTTRSFSHSAILSAWFNGQLEQFCAPADAILRTPYAEEFKLCLDRLTSRYNEYHSQGFR